MLEKLSVVLPKLYASVQLPDVTKASCAQERGEWTCEEVAKRTVWGDIQIN